MRTILFFTRLGIYLAGSLLIRIKLNNLKKKGHMEQAERLLHKSVMKWGKFTIDIIGGRVKVSGEENIPEGNCLFVANHQSDLDIPLMAAYIDKPMGFIAKKELLKVPVVSYWMKEMHCIFMDRDNIRESVKSINEGIDYLKNGFSMVIFPEGTRSKEIKMNEFKKGSMKLGIKADVPIVPVAINGTYKMWEENNKVRPADVTMKILKPVYAKDLPKEEQNNLAEIIQSIIEKEITSS
jgi:1-acyl-sn-glycerol-3-phosphate acyltransferase